MDDGLWTRDEVESPCIRVCVVHRETRLCTGCFRSVDEISRWSAMTAKQRRAILAKLKGRAGKLARRRGGRAARMKRRSR